MTMEKAAAGAAAATTTRTSSPSVLDSEFMHDAIVPGTTESQDTIMFAAKQKSCDSRGTRSSDLRRGRLFSPPVSTAELLAFKGFTKFYRQQNFLRYQIRIQIRLVVSLALILAPLVSSLTNVYYSLGFPQDERELWVSLIVPFVFLCEDLIEWYVVTFRLTLFNQKQVVDLVPPFLRFYEKRHPLARNFRLGLIGACMLYLLLMFQNRYPTLRFNLVDKIGAETGWEKHEADLLTIPVIWEYCGW
ncbi:unnamed protein product [Amoebophrya sp. A120]|nr:unnamed protein product [Amoebophrya sp. A120]|eukprot:GSA120T00008498001.1